MNIPLSRAIPYAAGGAGMAALENKYVGDNLPPELKHVNTGIGLGTGLMLASHNPEMQTAALTSIPLKEMALFGIGGMDRFRRSQQALTDTHLRTARIGEDTARMEHDDAGSRKRMALAFLVPALAAGGALGYEGYLKYKKKHEAGPKRFQTVGSKGTRRQSQRVRIDIPPSALPKEFYQSLGQVEDDPRTYTAVQEKRPMGNRSTSRFVTPDELNEVTRTRGMTRSASAGAPMKVPFKDLFKPDPKRKDLTYKFKAPGVKSAYAQRDDRPSLLSMLGHGAVEATGVPSLVRGVREAGYGMNTLGEGDYRNAGRYGLSSAADLGLGALGLRWGVAPVLGRMFGRGRLSGVLRNEMAAKGVGSLFKRRQLTEFPTAAKFLNRNAFGNELAPNTISEDAVNAYSHQPGNMFSGVAAKGPVTMTGDQRMQLRSQIGVGPHTVPQKLLDAVGLYHTGPMDRAIRLAGRYDPTRYDWENPSGGVLSRMLGARTGASAPRTLVGHGIESLRYGANRAVDTAYQGKQLVKRWPNATASLALPSVAAMGVVRDDEERKREMESDRPYYPDWSHNRGPQGMPVSSMFSNLMGAVTGSNGMGGLQRQLGR